MLKPVLLLAIGLAFSCISCSKEEGSCYSESLEEAMKGSGCTMDCPGVCGCDGNTYCNECMAKLAGIKETIPGPCD